MTTDTLTIRRPDDWHLHLRDGDALRAVVGDTARVFGRAIVMPNLKPPVATTEAAIAYRERILLALGSNTRFEPLMTLYLTDMTSPDEIRRAKDSGVVFGVKLYPAGATTNSQAGVTNLKLCWKTLETMQAIGMPLLVHGEVTHPSVDPFDREKVFIDEQLIPLRRAFPQLRIVFEHITTSDAAHYVRDCGGSEQMLGATLTAHHLLYSRTALFEGGLRPHYFCLPVLKRESHRHALVAAATSGDRRYFLGTDSAPHERHVKEAACCGAGCYTAPHAMALYATAFDRVGKLAMLENFASNFGADFYGLPRNTDAITLIRRPYQVPQKLPYGDGELIPLAAGETLPFSVASGADAA
jgi:dihydroorotase